MLCYKGFNEKLQCQPDETKAPFQFEVGKTYEEENAMLCKSGFHACENPLDVFGYYNPAKSRYCLVNLDEVSSERESIDSKICGRKIHIEAEIGLKGIIEAGVKLILDKVDFKDNKKSNTGSQSAATNTGFQSAATVEGKESIAISVGIEGKAKGTMGSWIVLSE